MVIFFERIDSAPVYNLQNLPAEFVNWITNMVDSENELSQQIETQFNGQGIATFITRKTSAQITALIGMNAEPVIDVGALWFDTTISKLKVLVTAAVPGVSNGTTETVTSV